MRWLLVIILSVILAACGNTPSPLSLTNTAIVEVQIPARDTLRETLLNNPNVVNVDDFWVAVEPDGLARVGGSIEIALAYDPAPLIEQLITHIQQTFPNRHVLIDVGLVDSLDLVAQIEGNITMNADGQQINTKTTYNVITYGTTNPEFATQVATANPTP